MKIQYSTLFTSFAFAGISFFPIGVKAQMGKISNLRPYDKKGINIFEPPKDTSVKFDGLQVRFGAGFTQAFQNLKDENDHTGIPANKLYAIAPGFNTAEANLYMDVQLADGIRLNLTSYLSSRHHNETWVKGGFIQFDKLPFDGQFWTDLMKVTTIKVGHMEINYGDAHFRRSDGGHTLYNPFVENNIMDDFTTEIGGEVYVHHNSLFGMLGITGGMIKGNIDSLVATPQDANIHKSPSIYLKAGFDKQLNQDVRLRLSASYYGNQSSGGNTLFAGDRTGSNYLMVVEPAAGASYTTNETSGRFSPGFSKKVNTVMLNAFIKFDGLELFGTYENAAGRNKTETIDRTTSQYAVDGVYRFGQEENLFLGLKYNVINAELANTPTVTYAQDININRFVVSGGWFLTKNILLKGEYVTQKYSDFPVADYRNGAKFNGYIVQAVVGF